MSRRCVEREYAEKECDEVCQDILARDRFELRERSRTTDRCQCETTRRCEKDCDNWDNDNSTTTNENRRIITDRISGQECDTDDIDNCQWEDPCRCGRNWDCGCNRCGRNWDRCDRNRCNCERCCQRNRRGCGCSRGLHCDRNRRLRSCCTCKDDCE